MTEKELLEIIKVAARKKEKTLDLSGQGIKHLPAEIWQLTNLTDLDLSQNQLSSLPAEIGQLKNLTKLDLFYNQLRSLPAEVWQLTNLTKLDLSNNQLISLPAEIGQLTNLTELVLNGYQLSSLPAEIWQLTNLRKLELAFNQLKQPAKIGQLKNLTELSLEYNQLTALPAEILKLTNLTRLDLSSNQLTALPAEIGKLKNLTKLELSHNKLTALPAEIGQLKNLKRLELYGNQLRSLPAEIGVLSNLTQLGLSNNQLTSLPAEIGQLKNLTELSLHSNKLTSLPAEIWALSNLRGLWLYNNQLTSLPTEILKLNMNIKWEIDTTGKGIFLADNTWEQPPVEIIKKGKKAIKTWFEALKEEGGKRLNEVKVLLVGYGGAGKTSLVRKLTTGKFKKNEPKTHGVKRTDWKIKSDGEDITVHFWDYGGQGIMQATHRVFFSHRSLYILVIDARQESDTEEWLKNIESIGGKSPVLVVINKIDEHQFGLNEPDLERKYPNIKGFYHVSCKDGEGIKSFERELKRYIRRVETIGIEWPKRWARVKERISKMRKDYIAYSKYEEICREEEVVQEKAQRELIGVLHELGVMLHFPDRCLPNMEVLNPEWATEGIYKIINSKKLKECEGLLPGDTLEYVLNKEKLEDGGGKLKRYSKDEQRYILELMKKFELCYELKDGTILVPDLLAEKEPRKGLPKKPNVRFYFKYDFMPAVVMPRFMVQKRADLDAKMCWRTGAVLKNKTFRSVAVVRQDKNEKMIKIEVTGKEARGYLSAIRDIIKGINQSFEKLPFEEWVPLPGEEKLAVKYDDLIGHEESRREEKFVGELRKGYSVAELLDGIEDPQKRGFGLYILYPPFFEILPGEESFADAWEIFCCEVLNRYEKTTEIVRRKAPEGGVDLLWREKKRAYQCKSVIDPITNRFDVNKAVKSVKAAIAKRSETGWKTFYICSNVGITGPQENKLRKACPNVDLKLLPPSFWQPRCREQHTYLDNRFSKLKRPHEGY